MANLQHIIDQIKVEIEVDLHGKGKASIGGTARLCDVSQQTLSEAYRNSRSKLFLILAEHGFEPNRFSEAGVPDIAVALTVSYYSNRAGKRCTQQAKDVGDAFLSMGVRVWMQQVAGWQDPATRKLTPDEIAQLCLSPSVRTWKPRFESEYYQLLSKLTGLHQEGHLRPHLWGRLTDEWIYRLLPIGVREGVRKCRDQGSGWDKLHQFLSDDGLEVFRRHMEMILLLMKASETVNGMRRALKNLTATEYQYRLFEDCRQDGKLTISKRLIEG